MRAKARQVGDGLTIGERSAPLNCSLQQAAGVAVAQQRSAEPQNSVAAATDDFPYRADDFPDGEVVFNGKSTHNPDEPDKEWQKHAYDLGAMRPVEGGWVDVYDSYDSEDPKNGDYVINGKPVYAVSDGVVVNAWRNAPENPRPYTPAKDPAFVKGVHIPLADQTWLHPDTRAGKVFGSGNFLIVREDDGALVHYAHAQPGTISTRLCPHEGTHLSPATWEADSAVPVDRQVRVRRGEKLFLTGNSGTSSAPHLHIERFRTPPYAAVPLLFRHGTARTFADGTATSPTWKSFLGHKVPGPALIRPPLHSGGLYAWHGMNPAVWQDRFEHLADSGYRPVWLDSYSVAGKPFYNAVFEPAQGRWSARHGLTGDEYQAAFDAAVADGLQLVLVDSSTVNGQARYSAVFAEAEGGFAATHGLDDKAFQEWFVARSKEGLSPVTVSTISVSGARRHTALFRKQDLGGWVLDAAIPADRYQSVYDENRAAGRHPFTVNAYKHDGKVFFCVTFAERPAGARRDGHGMSSSAYATAFGEAGAAGLRLRAVAGVDGATSQHQYIAAWRG